MIQWKKYICKSCRKPMKTQKSLDIIITDKKIYTYHKVCWKQFLDIAYQRR